MYFFQYITIYISQFWESENVAATVSSAFCLQVFSFITISCQLLLFGLVLSWLWNHLNCLIAKMLTAWIYATSAKLVITPYNQANRINKFMKHLNLNACFVISVEIYFFQSGEGLIVMLMQHWQEIITSASLTVYHPEQKQHTVQPIL